MNEERNDFGEKIRKTMKMEDAEVVEEFRISGVRSWIGSKGRGAKSSRLVLNFKANLALVLEPMIYPKTYQILMNSD